MLGLVLLPQSRRQAIFPPPLALKLAARSAISNVTGTILKLLRVKSFSAVLVPLLTVGRGMESALPSLLVVPSLFYMGLFAYSMFVENRAKHHQDADKLQPSKSS
jgi:hypothetical protein